MAAAAAVARRGRGRPRDRCDRPAAATSPGPRRAAAIATDHRRRAEEDARQAELDAVTHDIALTAERQAELKGEIDALDKDRATLNQSLIETSQRGPEARRRDRRAPKRRLKALLAKEEQAPRLARRTPRRARRGARRAPAHGPPAAAGDPRPPGGRALLGPERHPARRRRARSSRRGRRRWPPTSRQLVAVREAKEKERDGLRTNATALAEGRARIALLMDQRQNQRQASADALADEEKRAGRPRRPGDQPSGSDRPDGDRDRHRGRGRSRRPRRPRPDAQAERGGQPPRLARQTPTGLTPKVAFADAKGLLPLPATGTRNQRLSATMTASAAKPRAFRSPPATGRSVSSPSDGWVVYAGPFRSYGQLLIINAGDGYHVLLAGMERIDVQLGQFVLAGEPVAVMAVTEAGERRRHGHRRNPACALYRIPERRDFDRPGPMVGRIQRGKGRRMIRKVSLLLGRRPDRRCWRRFRSDPAADAVSARTANRRQFRHLSRAQPVRRRVRARSRRLRRSARRQQADRIGDQRHAGRARPAFELPEPQELQGHAGRPRAASSAVSASRSPWKTA